MLQGFLLFSLATAVGFSTPLPQTQGRRVHIDPEVEAEHRGDPPAPAMFHLRTPGMHAPFGILTSVQVNVDALGRNIVGDAANEPSIAVDPTNPGHISIAWRQFDSVTSNFREAGYGYSVDGGKTWTFPGVLQNNVFRSDPVLSTDFAGNFNYLSLLETFFDDIWTTTNWGQSWASVASAEGGDKEWMTIDRSNSIGRGNIYQTWSIAGNNYGGRQFTRSTNGGQTWLDPINIPNQPFWGTIDTGPNGECYVCGTDQNGTLWFVRSSNAKDPTATPTFDLATAVDMGGSIGSGAPINPDGLWGQLWVAADKSGGATNGNIYLLGTMQRNSSNPADVMFSRSTDGGHTWSAPLRVNDDAANSGRYHWFGTLAVAPNGRLDAVWNDTRNDLTGKTSELFYSYSLDGGVTWAKNQQVSPAFDETVGYPNQNKIGDYIGMVSDNTGADVAYSATFNNEEDIYFVRIPAVEVLPPDSYAIVRGLYVSGNVASLAGADSADLIIRNGPTLTSSEAPFQVTISAHSAVLSPSALQFKLLSSVSTPGLSQTILLFNFQINAYEAVDVRTATTSEQAVAVSATGSISRFVNQSTGEVRALLKYQQVQPTLSSNWRALLDQAQWSLTP